MFRGFFFVLVLAKEVSTMGKSLTEWNYEMWHVIAQQERDNGIELETPTMIKTYIHGIILS